MKLSRNAIFMLKSAYKSIYLRGLVLGATTICCMTNVAEAYLELTFNAPGARYDDNKDKEYYGYFMKTPSLQVGSESGTAGVFVDKIKADLIKVQAPWEKDYAILTVASYDSPPNEPGETGRLKMTHIPESTPANISIGQNSAYVYGDRYSIGEFGWGGQPGTWSWSQGEHLRGARYCVKRAGGISQNGIKAMLYVTTHMGVAKDVGITVDGDEISPATEKNVFRIGPNSAVVLGKYMVANVEGAEDSESYPLSAINFRKTATVSYVDSSKILLDSEDINLSLTD